MARSTGLELKREFVRRNDVMEMLGVGEHVVKALVKHGRLVPRYLYPKARGQFLRRDVEKIISNSNTKRRK